MEDRWIGKILYDKSIPFYIVSFDKRIVYLLDYPI